MNNLVKAYCFLLTLLCAHSVKAQITISGTVYDSSKVMPVKKVLVQCTCGTSAITDSLGHYNIVAKENDSIYFTYNNKPTLKFAVLKISNITSFDIALKVHVKESYKMLKEVTVFGKTYKQDSAENREEYAKIFDYDKPHIKTSSASDYSGAAGLDLDEFINMFRFKRNARIASMQKRLMEEEEEKYIDYRFNKSIIKRITRLDGEDLDEFVKKYRPDYEFTVKTSIVDFYQYILNASYEFKRKLLERKNKPAL